MTARRYDSLDHLHEAMRTCVACDLAASRTQVVPGSGPADADVMLLGEAPGAREDMGGAPFVGAAGRLLDAILEEVGVERSRLYIANTVACRPPSNRNPRAREMRAHAPWLEEQLRLVAPRVVVTLGRVPLIYFVPGAKITQEHGRVRPVERGEVAFQLLPSYHPAAALRRRTELLPVLREDLGRLPALLEG
ncbi:MAG TPA: uracil-DNA glycosylase [Longimicrobiales bacterium]|nr:uracil-DNA glycosylase [Longimicrobiales bacterium]